MIKTENSWAITSDIAKEKVMKAFPMLRKESSFSRGMLCYLEGCKLEMQIGFVFSLQHKRTGADTGCVIYYPLNGIIVQKDNKVIAHPVEKWTSSIGIENGYATVEFLNGEAVMVFNQYQ